MIRLKRLYAHDFKQLKEVELKFPDVGRFLVQGKNEAGKSTLFEAIYFALFAQALTTEGTARALDDLIGYEKEKARVELDLAVGERLFKIMRTLRRGKANQWELDIAHPDGRIEQVRSNRPVNDRLVGELGFDAEALLNTCFVEQKKLEKLEGMSKPKREESLAKLLNLERLLDLEEKLKLRGEDEKLLTRLQHRVELAQAQAELPGVEDELERSQGQLRLLELHAQVEHAIEEMRACAALAAERDSMMARRDSLKTAVARVDALDKAQQSVDVMLTLQDSMAQDADQIAEFEKERQTIKDAVAKNLPALEERLRAVRRLGLQVARLVRVEATRGNATLELQRGQAAQQELNTHLERGKALNETIEAHRGRLASLDSKLHNYDVGDALGEWAAAAERAMGVRDGSTAIADKQHQRQALQEKQRRFLYMLGALILAIVLASAFVLPALAFATGNFFLTVIVALALAALATGGGIVLAGRLLTNTRDTTRLTQEIGQLEGEANARRALAADAQSALDAATTKLKAMGISLPSSHEFARAQRIEIAATLENKTRAELEAERQDLREKLNYAQAQRDEVAKRINESSPSVVNVNVARCERVLARCERILSRWRPLLARRAAAMELSAETESLREAFRATQSDIKLWQARIQQAAKIETELAKVEQRFNNTRRDMQSKYGQVATLLNGQAPAWNASLSRQAYLGVRDQLQAEFALAGGESVRAEMSNVENRYGATEREWRIREKNVREAISAAHHIELELGIRDGLADQPTLEELAALSDRLTNLNFDDKPRLQAQVNRLHQRVGELKGARDRFERELGLVGESVDLEQAQAELAREQQAQLQRKYGAEIVSRARKRIVQKVLPATMEYMRRILPQLTRDRYHDAELDPETYRIKVWDERAGQSGAWKEKNIFSGGTKDQFSLALRLAFALATLPQERGTSPGFIFLDEPLGSFDEERASALLYLLTEGEIGRAFDQIFLISHVPVQENKFTHKIRLESGVVVESSLDEK